MRYSILAPFSTSMKLQLTTVALKFFSPTFYAEACKIIGKEGSINQILPFTAREFVKYLEVTGALEEPDRYGYRLHDLLANLAKHNVLREVGKSGDPLLGTHYYFLRELTEIEKIGTLWLAEALGPEFLLNSYSSSIVQITGITTDGDIHAGTGLIISESWILTCAHVLSDMTVDNPLIVNGSKIPVKRTVSHSNIDIGLIEVDAIMLPIRDMAFRDPVVSERVYTLGYPRIPLSLNASLVMQSGEVTNTDVTLFNQSKVFLYSAVARPGNSGGPIIASTGHVVGVVTEELLEKTEDFRMPFHAGIFLKEIEKAISEMGCPVKISVESFK